ALDITTDREQVVAFLDGKRLEAALVNRSGSLSVMVGVPAPHMRDRQPLQISAERAIFLGPNDQVPMVRHDQEAEKAHVETLPGLPQDLLEGGVIGFVKQGSASNCTVENVVDVTSIRATGATSHTSESDNGDAPGQGKTNLTPFSPFDDHICVGADSIHGLPSHPEDYCRTPRRAKTAKYGGNFSRKYLNGKELERAAVLCNCP